MSIGQALESFLQKRLEILGGRSQGTWSVDCETLQSVPNLTGEDGRRNRLLPIYFIRPSTPLFPPPLSLSLSRSLSSPSPSLSLCLGLCLLFLPPPQFPFLPPSGTMGQKTVLVIHSSEYPRTTFLILESLLCLVAENSLDTIFAHLKQFYPPRKQPKIEVKGKMFLVKRYLVKFGAISIGSTNRGIVVEVCVQSVTQQTCTHTNTHTCTHTGRGSGT